MYHIIQQATTCNVPYHTTRNQQATTCNVRYHPLVMHQSYNMQPLVMYHIVQQATTCIILVQIKQTGKDVIFCVDNINKLLSIVLHQLNGLKHE